MVSTNWHDDCAIYIKENRQVKPKQGENNMEKETLEALIKSDDMGLLALRKEYARFFKTVQRSNGEVFITTVKYAPTELEDFIYSVHRKFFCTHNDWIYSVIQDAFLDLSSDDLDDITISSDVYDKELCDWIKEPYAKDACNECLEEGLCGGANIIGIISFAQFYVKQQIYEAVNDFIKKGE